MNFKTYSKYKSINHFLVNFFSHSTSTHNSFQISPFIILMKATKFLLSTLPCKRYRLDLGVFYLIIRMGITW